MTSSVYPRWRGEHFSRSARFGDIAGLSPLARGTHKILAFQTLNFAVYPRWRGEHSVVITSHIDDPGLSPLARGTLRLFPAGVEYSRFIPAGAGNTCRHYRTRSLFPVYPRWRGEHARPRRSESIHAGLSPLARGTPNHLNLQAVDLRFIPAGAGNTKGVRTQLVLDAVYPRWRGEH